MKAIAKELQLSELTFTILAHRDIRYKLYVQKRYQFMHVKTEENGLICTTWLLKLKIHHEQGVL